MSLDKNLHPVRADLAASRYKGQIEAARFVDGQGFHVRAAICPLRAGPADDGEQYSQAFHGDNIDIYEQRDGFGWGQMASDNYVGWFDMAALAAGHIAPTHRVIAVRAPLLLAPKVRAATAKIVPLNAALVIKGAAENNYLETDDGLFVHARHVAAFGADFAPDPASVAMQFLGAPYQWGGKESAAMDCSGLVQTAFAACGISLPRDAYMQRDCGTLVQTGSPLRRNDIICWKGHVGLMLDSATIIHANGYWMATAAEDFAEVEARIGKEYGPVLCVRRLM